MEPNPKGLLLDSFKPLQNKAFIVLNALFDNNVSGSTIKLSEEPKIIDICLFCGYDLTILKRIYLAGAREVKLAGSHAP